MKLLVTIATAIVVGAVAVVAWGFPKESGFEPKYRPKSACPQTPCSATGYVTGFQVKQQKTEGGDIREFPTRVRRTNGWLVAFSLTLGDLTEAQARAFNRRLWEKPASARISILDPEPMEGDRRNRRQRYRLHNQSETFDVRPFFGKKAWFVLTERMHVSRGQVIALTLPTWAPVLATELSTRERWRSSRSANRCNNVVQRAAQTKVGSLQRYGCVHTGARLLFTALVVQKTPENKSR